MRGKGGVLWKGKEGCYGRERRGVMRGKGGVLWKGKEGCYNARKGGVLLCTQVVYMIHTINV